MVELKITRTGEIKLFQDAGMKEKLSATFLVAVHSTSLAWLQSTVTALLWINDYTDEIDSFLSA